MVTRGPLVCLKAEAGTEGAAEKFLRSALTLVQVNALFGSAPSIQPLDVLANKLPKGAAVAVSTAILPHFKRRAQHEQNVGQLLRDTAPPRVQEEKPIAWFIIRTSDRVYCLFDVIPDNAGHSVHRTGYAPGEYVKRAFALPGSVLHPAFMLARSLQPVFGTFR